MIGQRSYAGTGDAIQYNKRFFHLSSMAPRAQTMPNRKLRPKPQWALEDSIRHSPGFGIVSKAVWTKGVRERLLLLRAFSQGVYPPSQRRVSASEEVFLAVLHLARQGLQHLHHMVW